MMSWVKGKASKKKKWFLSLWGLTPLPQKVIKIFSIFFWILDHFLSTFWKKCFFAPRKAEKFSKFAKNEVKAIKVAVSTAMRDVSAAPHGVSVAPRGVSAAPRGMSATPCGMLAGQDTPGAWGTLGGVGGYYTWKIFMV